MFVEPTATGKSFYAADHYYFQVCNRNRLLKCSVALASGFS